MTTPTQNGIPSSTAIDVRFNAEKLDEIINSDNETYSDRFGNSRFTIKGVVTYIQNILLALSGKTGDASIGTPDRVSDLKTLSVAANSMLRVKGYSDPYDGGSGTWYYDSSDQTANVSAYPNLFIAPSSDLTGSSGCWRLVTQDAIPAVSYGVGVSKDPNFNKSVLEQIVAYNKGYRTVSLPARTIVCRSLVFNYDPNFLGSFGAIASVNGGLGTAFLFSDKDVDGTTAVTESCIKVAPSNETTGRMTGLCMRFISIIGKEGINGLTTFSTRTGRLALDLNYVGGQVEIENVFVVGFTQGLSLNEAWDGSLTRCRVIGCGSPDGVTPAVWMGSKRTDNTNAMKFWGLHVEHCPFMMQLDFVRHTEFYGCKFESLRPVDTTSNSILINAASQEVLFSGTMFVTTAQTLTHYMQDKGQNTKFVGCTFDSTGISSSMKYPGIRWYKGVLSTSSRSNSLIGCKFTRVLPCDGSVSDDHPIILADGDSFKGEVFVDNTVTPSSGQVNIVNSGIISLGNNSSVEDLYLSANTNTKTAGPVFYFRGSGAIVKSLRTKPGNPIFSVAGGDSANWFNNTVENVNAKWASSSASAINVVGKTTVFFSSAVTVTSLIGTVGQEVNLVSYVSGSTITYNASTLITNSKANISMAANTAYKFVCRGNGQWTQVSA